MGDSCSPLGVSERRPPPSARIRKMPEWVGNTRSKTIVFPSGDQAANSESRAPWVSRWRPLPSGLQREQLSVRPDRFWNTSRPFTPGGVAEPLDAKKIELATMTERMPMRASFSQPSLLCRSAELHRADQMVVDLAR